MRGNVVDEVTARFIPHDSYPETWDVEGLTGALQEALNLELPVADWAREEGIGEEEVAERTHKAADEAYAARIEKNTADVMRYVEKQVVLQVLDHFWREHLVMLDHLRQVIGWRGYAQRDPLNEYKSEAFELFNSLISRWHEVVTQQLMRVEVAFETAPPEPPPMQASHIDAFSGQDEEAIAEINARIAAGEFTPQALGFGPPEAGRAQRDPRNPATWGKVGRNEACPCGSGRKFKHCHGALV
jgi:preprotein translocase subunit SecA